MPTLTWLAPEVEVHAAPWHAGGVMELTVGTPTLDHALLVALAVVMAAPMEAVVMAAAAVLAAAAADAGTVAVKAMASWVLRRAGGAGAATDPTLAPALNDPSVTTPMAMP